MNGEQISDSLIYLDDDLIAETDAVRQGKRIPFRMPARGILAAACAALLLAGALALPQRAGDDAAESVHNGMEMSNAIADGVGENEFGGSTSTSGYGNTITVSGITVTIPPDWEWARQDTNGAWGDHVVLSHGENHLIVGYYPSFAVCGVGLQQETSTIAGMEVCVGTFDGKDMWDFIIFPGNYVALNESGENWTEAERTAILEILESLTLEP